DPSYWLVLFYLVISGTKRIVAVDSTALDKPRKRLGEAAKTFFLKLCDGAFGYGSRSKEYCVGFGMRGSAGFTRCQATNNALIESLFAKAKATVDHDRKAFIYVGRLSPEKNVETLIRSFQRMQTSLGDRADGWKLRIVGEGPIRPDLERLVSE